MAAGQVAGVIPPAGGVRTWLGKMIMGMESPRAHLSREVDRRLRSLEGAIASCLPITICLRALVHGLLLTLLRPLHEPAHTLTESSPRSHFQLVPPTTARGGLRVPLRSKQEKGEELFRCLVHVQLDKCRLHQQILSVSTIESGRVWLKRQVQWGTCLVEARTSSRRW